MFVTPAYAQDAAAGAAGSIMTSGLVPMILIVGIMYFLMIRPQQKRLKEHRAMVEALRRGDQVVTQGGILGKVTKIVNDGEVEVEIAPDTKVRVVRSTITDIVGKTEPVKDNA